MILLKNLNKVAEKTSKAWADVFFRESKIMERLLLKDKNKKKRRGKRATSIFSRKRST